MPSIFDAHKIPYEYEMSTFVLSPAFDYKNFISLNGKKVSSRVKEITYTPDFVGKDWIIETKGMITPDFTLKWKLFKKHCVDNNLPFTLFMPSNQAQVRTAIEYIANKL